MIALSPALEDALAASNGNLASTAAVELVDAVATRLEARSDVSTVIVRAPGLRVLVKDVISERWPDVPVLAVDELRDEWWDTAETVEAG